MVFSMESQDIYRNIFNNLDMAVNSDTIEKLQIYVSLLKKWNSRINLIASNEWPLIESLLQEGLWASKMYPRDAKTHLDIGSGAGFPSIPIYIAVTGMQLDMVESRMKRVSFLETVSRELKISGIRVHHSRIDQYLVGNCNIWDCISWKAVKIRTEELVKLKEHAHKKTQFWIFHGKELAVEDPKELEMRFRLVRRERFPFKSEWMLSIYLPE